MTWFRNSEEFFGLVIVLICSQYQLTGKYFQLRSPYKIFTSSWILYMSLNLRESIFGSIKFEFISILVVTILITWRLFYTCEMKLTCIVCVLIGISGLCGEMQLVYGMWLLQYEFISYYMEGDLSYWIFDAFSLSDD